MGDNIFFLGMNNSLSLSAQDIAGCKANCIYFTDDYILYRWTTKGHSRWS